MTTPHHAPISVALFNDTGDSCHVGCQAVSQAHRHMLRREGADIRHAFFLNDWRHLANAVLDEGIRQALASRELRDVLADVDVVVVNGEGTIHHQGGRHLLAILGAAQRLGVPTLLVNAVLQDIDDARDVLAAVSDCTVRDAYTSRYLDSLGVAHRLIPDSFFEAHFLDTPRHDFAESLVITDCHVNRAAECAPQLSQLRDAWPGRVADYPLKAQERLDDWQHALADVRRADVVVTGRHHGACLALRAGVPFVTLPSTTWKVEGLIATLDGYPVDAADASRPLVERVSVARAHRRWFGEQAVRWKDVLPLPTFAHLRRVRTRPRATEPGCAA